MTKKRESKTANAMPFRVRTETISIPAFGYVVGKSKPISTPNGPLTIDADAFRLQIAGRILYQLRGVRELLNGWPDDDAERELAHVNQVIRKIERRRRELQRRAHKLP